MRNDPAVPYPPVMIVMGTLGSSTSSVSASTGLAVPSVVTSIGGCSSSLSMLFLLRRLNLEADERFLQSV